MSDLRQDKLRDDLIAALEKYAADDNEAHVFVADLREIASLLRESREAPAPPEKEKEPRAGLDGLLDNVAANLSRVCTKPHLPAGHYALAPDDPYFAAVDALAADANLSRAWFVDCDKMLAAAQSIKSALDNLKAADPRTRAGREPKEEKPETEAGAALPTQVYATSIVQCARCLAHVHLGSNNRHYCILTGRP